MPNHSTRRARVSRKRRVNRKVRSKAIRRRTKKGGMGRMMGSVGRTLGKGISKGARIAADKTQRSLKAVGDKTVELGQRGLQATSSAAQVALKKGAEGTVKALKTTGEGVRDTAIAGYKGFKQDPNKPAVESPEESPLAPVAQVGGSKKRRSRRTNRKSKKGGNGCGSGTVVPTGGSKRRGRRTNRKSKRGGNRCGTGKRGGYGKVTRGGNGCGSGKRGGNHCMSHTKKRGGNHCMSHTKKRGGHGHAIHTKK